MRGSSPRMRGSLSDGYRRGKAAGIIPAHAGLTGYAGVWSADGRDHPRACGAHLDEPLLLRVGLGSSPRMRGSLIADLQPLGTAGIIPAHAGLTPGHRQAGSSPWDHPRACGAHYGYTGKARAASGSSPRMRGSRFVFHNHPSGDGIIPAHAGLTIIRADGNTSRRDHPRACGAHPCPHSSTSRRKGSSPRMRGSRRYQ